MSEFLDLASLHQYLEGHAIDHLFGADIVKLFDKLKQSLPSDISADQIMRCDWEALVFKIHFQDGDPNHADLGILLEPQAYSYLERRLTETRNPILKSRYSHTL